MVQSEKTFGTKERIMPQDNTLIILGVCGFLTVCFGLLVLAFTTIFRFTGRNFMGFLGLLVRNQKDVDKDDSSQHAVRKPNLRAIADSSDFDAALAKHTVIDHNPQNLPSGAAQAAPPPLTQPPPPIGGVPKQPTTLPGYIPGGAVPPVQSGTAQGVTPPAARPAGIPPTTQPTPDDLGWEDPSLKPRRRDDLRRRDHNDDDDVFGGLMDDDGGVLG